MKSASVVSIRATEARLKRRIRLHLKELGFCKGPDGTLVPPSLDKETYRSIHSHQRLTKLADHEQWLADTANDLRKYFASGADVNVRGIAPRLEIAPGDSWQSDLFRLAGLSWQIPISEGYGRRLRFLVWDDNNGKLLGLLALGDAVFNLRARDEFIGWDQRRRQQALVHLMDAYVLGAMPPYNSLLGGKLIASLIRTRDVVDAFNEKYRGATGLISKTKKNPRLAAVTVTSALGRSSVYNRVKLNGQLLLRPIGFTSGWGHFHISDALFADLRHYLKKKGDPYASAFKYGNGPNWRIRMIRRALELLGLNADIIRHGFAREVFFCAVATNAVQFLNGHHKRVRYGDLPSVEEAAKLDLERWSIPRSERDSTYRDWRAEYFFSQLTLAKIPTAKVRRDAKLHGMGD